MWSWQSFFSSKGRIGRGRFWGVAGVVLLGMLFGLVLAGAATGSTRTAFPYLLAVIVLVALVVGLNNQIKRLHDLNLSGWWILPVVLVAGVLALIGEASPDGEAGQAIGGMASLLNLGVTIALGSVRGSPFDNRFGPTLIRDVRTDPPDAEDPRD